MLLTTRKCEFGNQYFMYLGHIIIGVQFKIDHENIRTTMDWIIPSNMIKKRFFLRAIQYLRNFIIDFYNTNSPLFEIT